MKVTFFAADGLGARSMAALVETHDVTVPLNPGVRLAPYHYELPPQPTEEDCW
jgi:predicted metallo-beta-lactamase superfamily hydrolase